MSIQAKLHNFPVPDSVWEEYHIDQRINDRGVALDLTLVREAIEMDGRSRSELTDAMKDITELENPNSVQQMKLWLADNGLETDTLGKKAVAEMIKTVPPELQEVLTLRQQLAKSSVKKYQTMETCVCSDGRARGMFQFYGANRTGRWAGRLIQMQNLPQNHLEDLAEARALVRAGDFDAVEMLYEDVPDTLSQLIRTAFVPRSGTKFIVAQLKPASSLGSPEKNGVRRSLLPVRTFTVPAQARCSRSRLRSMASTAICVKKEKSQNWHSAMAAASAPSKQWALLKWG